MSRLVLRPGTTVHLAIDMQRVFADATQWQMADFHAIVPNVAAVAAAMPGRNLFSRFTVPHVAEHAQGHWQNFYRRWSAFTGAVLDPALVEVVDALACFATPDTLIDKPTYSIFGTQACTQRLAVLAADTLVFTGVETDVCVLASLLAAVDRGYRVVAVADALGSSSRAGHEAALRHVYTRMPDQVEIASTADVLAALAAAERA